MNYQVLSILLTLVATLLPASHATAAPAGAWKVGDPIVNYWAGPGYPGGGPLDDAAAAQLVEGGWNMVWCNEKELDVAQRHGLRGLLTDPLLSAAAYENVLDDPVRREALDALIARVRKHPSLYAYHLRDEPSAQHFAHLGKLVAYIRERDPAHFSYINLFPTYANNDQLGTKGATVEAYNKHIGQYVESVRPSLLSYDHYQLMNFGDGPQYFLNLAIVREKALAAGLPFMNIVQASCWVPDSAANPSAPRVPNGDEMSYLVYTTLAYGAQGISYYVYCYPRHQGGIVRPDGTPTPLYHALKSLNREFVAIARELQPLKSLGAFHAGMQPPGVASLPEDATYTLDPPVPPIDYTPGSRVQGILLGYFGPRDDAKLGKKHVLVVNLDYKTERTVLLTGPSPLDVFDATTREWSPVNDSRVELRLAGGGGTLVRVHP